MQAVKTGRATAPNNSTSKFILPAIFLAVLIVAALYINNISMAFQSESLPQKAVTISQSTLEEKYGVRVTLAALTAAGGLVDLRLKIIDGEKAKLLLQDKMNFPTLLVGDGKIILHVSEDTKAQGINFENNGNLYLLFPNAGNAVTPGASVTLLFGDIAIEPMDVR